MINSSFWVLIKHFVFVRHGYKMAPSNTLTVMLHIPPFPSYLTQLHFTPETHSWVSLPSPHKSQLQLGAAFAHSSHSFSTLLDLIGELTSTCTTNFLSTLPLKPSIPHHPSIIEEHGDTFHLEAHPEASSISGILGANLMGRYSLLSGGGPW
jgi:hypothetical protein